MNTPFDAAQAMARAWMDLASNVSTSAAVAGGTCPIDSGSPEAVQQQIRNAILGSLAQSTDQFLRSAPFLEMMKQSLDASIAFRRQLNDFLTQVQQSTQGVARRDVDNLMCCVRQVERRTLDRLEIINERLDQIAQRLEGLERSARSDAQSTEGREAANV